MNIKIILSSHQAHLLVDYLVNLNFDEIAKEQDADITFIYGLIVGQIESQGIDPFWRTRQKNKETKNE